MAQAAIVCGSCGTPASASGLACPACGSGLVKLCAKCQFKNSTQKSFCDRCGEPLNAAAPPPTATATPMPRQATPPEPRSRELLPSGALYFFKSVLAILFMFGLATIAALVYMEKKRLERPDAVVLRLAESYLGALSVRDYEKAYSILAPATRGSLTLEQFRVTRDTTPWSWSGLAIAQSEPDAMFLEYQLEVEGREPEKDYLLFTLEGGRWVRPYNWHILRETEAAFESSSADIALLRAQEAVRLNPRDPMARGYLCEALYYRKAIKQLEAECRAAIKLSRVYPSKLSPRSLYHLHAILGDSFKNQLSRPEDAIAEYGVMLAFPKLSHEDQCELRLARADSYAALGKAAQSVAELELASPLCAKPEDQKYIDGKLKELKQG